MADASKPAADPKAAAAPAPAPAPADVPPVPKDTSKGMGVYKSPSGAWINAHGEVLDADGNIVK